MPSSLVQQIILPSAADVATGSNPKDFHATHWFDKTIVFSNRVLIGQAL
jgi:hypothetical protein